MNSYTGPGVEQDLLRRIRNTVTCTKDKVLLVGTLLIQLRPSKARWNDYRLPFGYIEGRRYINVVSHRRIEQHLDIMPDALRTLGEIHSLTDRLFNYAVAHELIHPMCNLEDIRQLRRRVPDKVSGQYTIEFRAYDDLAEWEIIDRFTDEIRKVARESRGATYKRLKLSGMEPNRTYNQESCKPSETSYYDILRVSRWATASEIRTAYRKLARTYHPDIRETGSDAKFRRVREAYEVLSDPERRVLYDQGFTP